MPNTASRSFTWDIKGRPFEGNCNREHRVELHTSDPNSHLNLYVDGKCHCLHPDDAKSLRDALLHAYPQPKYTVSGVVVHEMLDRSTSVAQCATRDIAEQIAALLNGGAK